MMIQNKDCIEFLISLEDDSVDLIFTDPPYNAKKDYEVYKDDKSPEEYVSWMEEIVRECVRVSKRGIVFYVSGDLTKLFLDIIPKSELIIVHKRAAGVCKNNLARQYHSIITNAKPVKRTRNLWLDVRLPGEGYFFKETRYDNPGMTGLHLTEKVLDSFTLEYDIVADPFAGVGTTWVASTNMNRKFIGSELNPRYIKIAEDRISNCMVDEVRELFPA